MNLHRYFRLPRRMMPVLAILLGIVVLLLSLLGLSHPGLVSANSELMPMFETQYPAIAGTRLDACIACHTLDGLGLNPYGQAVLDNGKDASAFAKIEKLDSDKDGYSNIQEIQAHTFPGFPNDNPQATMQPTPIGTPTLVPTYAPTIQSTPIPTPTVSTAKLIKIFMPMVIH